jgi:tetratricopeptide (TPR) repeat protein
MATTLVMDPHDRIELLRESVAVARHLDDQPILAASLQSFGVGLLLAGRFDDALTAFAEGAMIIATVPGLTYLDPHVLSGRARALAAVGRLPESADRGASAVELLRREGAAQGEHRLLESHGDTLATLGRIREAGEAWRRFLTLASSPEIVQETNALDDNTDGAVTIDRVKAKLAVLIGQLIRPA